MSAINNKWYRFLYFVTVLKETVSSDIVSLLLTALLVFKVCNSATWKLVGVWREREMTTLIYVPFFHLFRQGQHSQLLDPGFDDQ